MAKKKVDKSKGNELKSLQSKVNHYERLAQTDAMQRSFLEVLKRRLEEMKKTNKEAQ